MPILIHNCAYLICNPQQVERDCDLLIEGTQIDAIGQNLPIPPDAEVLDGSRCVVMPGLVNPHTHLYQNFLKGVAPGLPLVPWCNKVLFPTVGALRTAMGSKDSRVPYLWSARAILEGELDYDEKVAERIFSYTMCASLAGIVVTQAMGNLWALIFFELPPAI